MARVYEGRSSWLAFVERPLYAMAGARAHEEMSWQAYAGAMLVLSFSPDSSFNTAVSFATNTNRQGHGGESTMSDLTQMLVLTVQNFVSATSGMACLAALVRGLPGAPRPPSGTSGSI